MFDYLASHVLAFVLSVAVLGLLVGSFLNVLIYRLPVMMQREWRVQAREFLELPCEPVGERFNLLLPNSRCPHCAHRIRAWENVPLISWLLLRGKCSSCRAPISCRYPLVELACGVLSGYVAWHFGFSWQAAMMLLLTWGLLAMSMIDVDHQLLPDSLVLPLLWLGLIVNHFGLFTSLESALVGGGDGLSESLVGVLAFQARHRQRGHGLRRLQAVGDAWGLGWLAGVAAYHSVVVSGRSGARFHSF